MVGIASSIFYLVFRIRTNMEKIFSADEIPYTANRLYIQLYCERKAVKDKKTIRDAKTSWKKLTVSEKKHFYKTSADRNLLKYAHSIGKTKTYLKEKLPRIQDNRLDTAQRNEDQEKEVDGCNAIGNGTELTVPDNSVEIELVDDENQNDTYLEITSEIQSNPDNNQEARDGNLLYEPTHLSENYETRVDDNLSNQEINVLMSLNEPALPIIDNGYDLYAMIKKPGDKNWDEFTTKEKRLYWAAGRAIKREYIKNYLKYLESLSQQQLFDHYMKTLY